MIVGLVVAWPELHQSQVDISNPTERPTAVAGEIQNPRYSGVWTVMDTGPAVRGRLVDLYLWSCKEALQFGRRSVRLTVLRLGWSPQNSLPGLVDTLFRKRETDAQKSVTTPDKVTP